MHAPEFFNDDYFGIGGKPTGFDLAADTHADRILASIVDINDFDALFVATEPNPHSRAARDYAIFQTQAQNHEF